MNISGDRARVVDKFNPENHIITENAIRVRNVEIKFPADCDWSRVPWLAEEMDIATRRTVLAYLNSGVNGI